MKVKSEREVAQLWLTLPTPWTAAYQAPPSMGFSRQEYWSGLPSIVKMSLLSKVNYEFEASLIQIPMPLFTEIKQS